MFKQERNNNFDRSKDSTGNNIISLYWPDLAHYCKNYSSNKKVTQWLDSNFIPTDSKKFLFRNFDYIMRFAMKNEPEIEKLRSRD